MFTSRRHKAAPAVVKGQMHIVLITAPCPKDHPSQCHSHKFKWQKPTDSTHAFCLQQLSGRATFADICKDGAFKNQSQVHASEFSICVRQKKNVGGRGDEAQAQQRHHTVQQFPNNPLQCPPPFRRLPFSLSLPACHLSPPSLMLSFLQTSASEQQLAHTSPLPSSPAPSLTPSSFLLYSFLFLVRGVQTFI